MREGWEIKTLGELAVKITDGSHNPPKGIEQSEYLMLSSQNVWNGYLDKSIARHLSKQDFLVEDKRTCAREGDVLLTIVGTIGRTCVLTREDMNITFQRSVCVIKPKPELNSFFLSYQLQFKNKEINEQANGAAQKGFYLKQVERLPIAIPSLPEQQRIVAILDREFAKIDALKANAEKSLQAAKDLFQATLKKELEPKAGWHNTSLHSICKSLFAGGDAPKGKISKIKTEEYSIPILSNGIGENAIYGYTTDARVFDKAITISARGTIGYVALRESPFFPIVRLIVAIPGDDVLAEYLKHYLTTISFRSDGTAIPQLTIPMIKDFVVTYPSKEKQRSIVSLLNDLNDRCKALQENYQKTLTLCDDLKQSLLRKAFSGEL